jgi:hypothetical protein
MFDWQSNLNNVLESIEVPPQKKQNETKLWFCCCGSASSSSIFNRTKNKTKRKKNLNFELWIFGSPLDAAG